jgi:hypothetical protein
VTDCKVVEWTADNRDRALIGVLGELGVPKKRSGRKKTVTLKMPADLHDRLSRLIAGTAFSSVTEFAVHVLRDVADGGRLTQDLTGYADREIQAVRERLRALGYIE